MGKTRGVHETTPELRNRMIGMYEAGLGLRDIAAAVNCSQRTVKRWLNRFDKEGTVETRERCGRKRATTSEEDDAIIRLATQTPITAAKAVLPALGLSCSVDTIRERLHKAGIHNWSPSRKHMQRIPLGSNGDSTTIQQAVWRPTGTQLGKKKSVSKDAAAKAKKTGVSIAKKKSKPLKVRARDVYVGDGSPSEVAEKSEQPAEVVYPERIVTEDQRSTINDQRDSLANDRTAFNEPLSLCQTSQPHMYQHHPGLNVVQNWPLDLVQGSHHYPHGQPHPMSNDQSRVHQHLHELHPQRQQDHRPQDQVHPRQDHQRHIHEHVQQQQQQSHDNSNVERPQHHQDPRMDHQHHRQPDPQISSEPKTSPSKHRPVKIIRSNGRSNSSSSYEPISDDDDLSKDGSKEDFDDSSNNDGNKKKKGGKAKGTLETSVEIRNRMIGMSEAGLSTLSIALAINRSERTVKRWLERWKKEGNVLTKERKGRRRITTKEQDEAIIAMATENPLTAAKHVAPALGLNCSVDTIRERLHRAGIHSWKLGKKQGEGNAVHTVHLWQPSGNRSNKPKLTGEKRKKSTIGKKRAANSATAPKRVVGKIKSDSTLSKIVTPTIDIISEPDVMQFHNGNLGNFVAGPEMMQQVQNLPVRETSIVEPTSGGSQASGPPVMQPMGSMMQQRSDCRMSSSLGSTVPGQSNPTVVYPHCMVNGNGDPNHMEQTDYEPYIWNF